MRGGGKTALGCLSQGKGQRLELEPVLWTRERIVSEKEEVTVTNHRFLEASAEIFRSPYLTSALLLQILVLGY